MEVIVPAAGLSSRFPQMRPKFSLTDHKGDLMLKNAICNFIGKYPIHIGILKEHDDQFNLKSLLKHQFGEHINVVVLEGKQYGPAYSVDQILRKVDIDSDSPIFIKDCDSFFDHVDVPYNYVCVSRYADNEIVREPSKKSYVFSNDHGIIQSIIEKQIISDKFCVGGYKFESVQLFREHFNKFDIRKSEIYVSYVIQSCMSVGEVFLENIVNNYQDVGNAQAWFDFNNKCTYFCDIDGTIIQAQPKDEYGTFPNILVNNVKVLKEKLQKGNEVVFVTSRPESERENTERMLNLLGFSSCVLVMGLKNSKRVLINDFNNANPYPRAEAINIERNSNSLHLFI